MSCWSPKVSAVVFVLMMLVMIITSAITAVQCSDAANENLDNLELQKTLDGLRSEGYENVNFEENVIGGGKFSGITVFDTDGVDQLRENQTILNKHSLIDPDAQFDYTHFNQDGHATRFRADEFDQFTCAYEAQVDATSDLVEADEAIKSGAGTGIESRAWLMGSAGVVGTFSLIHAAMGDKNVSKLNLKWFIFVLIVWIVSIALVCHGAIYGNLTFLYTGIGLMAFAGVGVILPSYVPIMGLTNEHPRYVDPKTGEAYPHSPYAPANNIRRRLVTLKGILKNTTSKRHA